MPGDAASRVGLHKGLTMKNAGFALYPINDTGDRGHFRLMVSRQDMLLPGFVELLLKDRDEIGRLTTARSISTVPSTSVFMLSFRDRAYYFKYFNLEELTKRIKAVFRGSRAFMAWKGANILSSAGCDTPRVVAVREFTGIKRGMPSLLVTEAYEGLSLRILSRTRPMSAKVQRDMARALGADLARMHNKGVVHGDLHPGNVLVKEKGGRYYFAYLDTERATVRGGEKGILRDLALLNHPNLGSITPMARTYFLLSYSRHRGFSAGQARILMGKVAGLS